VRQDGGEESNRALSQCIRASNVSAAATVLDGGDCYESRNMLWAVGVVALFMTVHRGKLKRALDDYGELTKAGQKMSQFPLDPPLSKMILCADRLGCVDEVLVVVSMLSVPSIFYRPKDRAEESDAAREKFFVPESDHLTLLYIYQQWRKHKGSAQWCAKHYLQVKALRKVAEVKSQLVDIVKQQKIELSTVGLGDWDVVRTAICAGYFHNAAKLRGIGEYINLLT
ncbi:hypothetical protein FOZ63_013769, partial [Perkinsus olseni]